MLRRLAELVPVVLEIDVVDRNDRIHGPDFKICLAHDRIIERIDLPRRAMAVCIEVVAPWRVRVGPDRVADQSDNRHTLNSIEKEGAAQQLLRKLRCCDFAVNGRGLVSAHGAKGKPPRREWAYPLRRFFGLRPAVNCGARTDRQSDAHRATADPACLHIHRLRDRRNTLERCPMHAQRVVARLRLRSQLPVLPRRLRHKVHIRLSPTLRGPDIAAPPHDRKQGSDAHRLRQLTEDRASSDRVALLPSQAIDPEKSLRWTVGMSSDSALLTCVGYPTLIVECASPKPL